DTLGGLLEKCRRDMEVPSRPVMKPEANAVDAVIERAHGRGGIPPQQLERFVLLEKLSSIELLYPSEKRRRWRVEAASSRGLVGCAGRLPFWRTRRLARATTRLGRARIR